MQKVSLHRILKKILAKENRLFLYLVVVITFVGFLSVFANKWSEQQTIRKFIITGNRYIPTSEIYSVVDTSLTNNAKGEIDFIKVKQHILKHPYVLNAYIIQKNSTVVEIQIEEREPIAIIVNNDGNIFYLEKYGKILPYRLSIMFAELPVLRGIFKNSVIDSTALESSLDIVSELSKTNFQEVNSIISEIIYSMNSKTFIMLTSDKAYEIKFGKAKDLINKFEILDAFMASVFKGTDVKNIDYIDLRWSNRVIVKYHEIITQDVQI